jgi:hypothetical protein
MDVLLQKKPFSNPFANSLKTIKGMTSIQTSLLIHIQILFLAKFVLDQQPRTVRLKQSG